jgi:hypothetical protein
MALKKQNSRNKNQCKLYLTLKAMLMYTQINTESMNKILCKIKQK